jgi:hypothetical protein
MADSTITPPLAATGKVIRLESGKVVFTPAGTSYELHLEIPSYTGSLNTPTRCLIRAKARKVYTVPSGGNFITPIFGPPRIVQGRVRSADQRSLVVHAAVPIHVELPGPDSAIDLDEGPITVGKMVNVVCEPGVRVEFL